MSSGSQVFLPPCGRTMVSTLPLASCLIRTPSENRLSRSLTEQTQITKIITVDAAVPNFSPASLTRFELSEQSPDAVAHPVGKRRPRHLPER